jgi:hypothetical protein
MKIDCYLIVSKSGSTSIRKGRPALNWDEVAILLNIDIPDAVFTRPQMKADIKIPDEAGNPNVISAETQQEVQNILQEKGFEVRVLPQEKDQEYYEVSLCIQTRLMHLGKLD